MTAARKRQAGSALIVSLILLAVLTVIGVAGMGAAILQERMAGNLQDGMQVFEAAESSLRLCEERVLAGDSDASGRADAGESAAFEAGASLVPARAELFRPAPANTLSAKGATEYRLRCLIEFTGPVDASLVGGSVRRPAVAADLAGYRVTAAGARIPADTAGPVRPTVILQSDVVTRD